MSLKLGIKEKEAQSIIDRWYASAPRVKPYQERIKKEAKENGYLTSYFGRKRRFWLMTEQNIHHVEREALNFPLQSTASDFTLESLIKLEPMLRGSATPRITVHDSLVFNVHRKDVYEVAQTIREVMEDTEIKDIVPTPVEFKTGYRWGSGVDWEPGDELPERKAA